MAVLDVKNILFYKTDGLLCPAYRGSRNDCHCEERSDVAICPFYDATS